MLEEAVLGAKLEKLRAQKVQIEVDVERMQIEMDVLRARLRESNTNRELVEARIAQCAQEEALWSVCVEEKRTAADAHRANARAAEAHTALSEYQLKREKRWSRDESPDKADEAKVKEVTAAL